MEKKELTLYNLLNLFLLRKRFIIISTSVLVILLLLYSFIMPHTYTADASIMPASGKKNSSGIASMLGNVSSVLSVGGLTNDTESMLFSEIISSKTVSEYIVKKHNLFGNEYFTTDNYLELIDDLRASVSTDVLKSGITLVSVSVKSGWFPSKISSDSAAKLSAMLTNTAIEGLNTVLMNQSISSAKQSRIYIDKQIAEYTRRLDSLEYEIQRFQETRNVLELTEQTTAIAEQGLEIAKEYSISEVELNLAKQIYSVNSPQYKSYLQKYNILQEQYYKSQKGGIVPTDRFSLPLDSIPQLVRVYYDLMRKREIMEHVIIYLQTQYFQEAIQEKRDVAEVEVLDSAKVPYKRTSPVRSIMLLVGSIVSLILVLIYVSIVAYTKGQLYIQSNE